MSQPTTQQTQTSFQKFLSLFKAINPADLDAMIADQEMIAKASQHAGDPGPMVRDLYQEGDRTRAPSREEIKIGPTFGASGASQEAMNAEYSRNAPQKGIELIAEQLGEVFGSLQGYMKAQATSTNAILTAMKALQKAAEEDGEEEEDEEDEVVEINEKAKSFFGQAQKRHAAAVKAKEDAEDCEPGETRRAHKANAARLRKSAAKLLLKAKLYAYNAGKVGKPVRKSVVEFIKANPSIKADIDVVQEEEEEDDEEADKARAAADATAKAEAAAKALATAETGGNQAAGQDANGNQPGMAAKAELAPEVKAEIDMLKGSVADLMAQLQGRDRQGQVAIGPGGSFKFMKGDPTTLIDKITAQVEADADDDKISSADYTICKALLGRMPAVIKGTLAESVFASQIQNAPESVRRYFENPKAAA